MAKADINRAIHIAHRVAYLMLRQDDPWPNYEAVRALAESLQSRAAIQVEAVRHENEIRRLVKAYTEERDHDQAIS